MLQLGHPASPQASPLDDPSFNAEFRVYNPDAGTGLPSWFDRHQKLDRNADPGGQPGHFAGTEIATESRTCAPARGISYADRKPPTRNGTGTGFAGWRRAGAR